MFFEPTPRGMHVIGEASFASISSLQTTLVQYSVRHEVAAMSSEQHHLLILSPTLSFLAAGRPTHGLRLEVAVLATHLHELI